MFDWLLSAKDYIKIFKDLKSQVPTLQEIQDHPEQALSQDKVVNFLWDLKQLYGKVSEQKELNIPHVAFLDTLKAMPNDKEQFAVQVRENLLHVSNNQLHINTGIGQSQPVGDFSNQLLNQIENWALTLFGTFGKK